MNMIRKLLTIFAFTCAASFSQQLGSTSKSVSQVSTAVTVADAAKDDSQKQLKKVVNVKRTPTTWTKIKDLFM
jgi:hypothetical protein